jgi:hypothetical protein
MRAILIATDITPTEVVTKSTSPRSRIAEQFQSELLLSVEMATTALANTIPGPVQDTAALSVAPVGETAICRVVFPFVLADVMDSSKIHDDNPSGYLFV